MGQQDRGTAIVIASVVLGASVLGAGYLMATATERAGQQIVKGIGEELNAAVEPAAKPARAAAPPRRGPDPDKRYTVNMAGAPTLGPDDAKVTIVEFSDFQCPFCARVNPTLYKLRDEYKDDVRIVFKHLPLSFHAKAPAAHAASLAAHNQGKFWEMHDKIFANQRAMSEENYIVWAGELDLDVDQFKKDMNDSKTKAKVSSDAKEASSLGVSGTPGFFINGRYMSGAKPYAEFEIVVDEELEKAG